MRIEEKNPLKQGLKHFCTSSSPAKRIIEEKNPLKQGLKHNQPSSKTLACKIEEKNPLKQGLKQKVLEGEIMEGVLLKRRIH